MGAQDETQGEAPAFRWDFILATIDAIATQTDNKPEQRERMRRQLSALLSGEASGVEMVAVPKRTFATFMRRFLEMGRELEAVKASKNP